MAIRSDESAILFHGNGISCDLCQIPLPRHPVEGRFCCHGCSTVYQILSSQGAISQGRSHPLFLRAVEAGIISNPDLLRELEEERDLPPEGVHKLHFEIGEMWCPSCAEVIRLILLRQNAIHRVAIDYATDLACVEYVARETTPDEFFAQIERLGYKPLRLEGIEERQTGRADLVRFGIAIFCYLNLMMLSTPVYVNLYRADLTFLSRLSLLFALPFVYCAWPILRRAVTGLRVGIVGMEALVALSVTTAFFFSLYQLLFGNGEIYFDSMGAIVALLLLGKVIERRAKFSLRRTLLQLSRTLPRRARRRDGSGGYSFVPLKEVSEGEILVVCRGERIGLDGEVIEGRGSCDERLLTGEVIPVSKRIGDLVVGGSILTEGWVAFRASGGSTLHQIVSVVELDLPEKGAERRLVDRVARLFVPIVVGGALTIAIWLHLSGAPADQAINRLLSMLLIACPCGIGIATPLVESLTMRRLSAAGAIVRNRSALNHLGKETVYLFDKTGTATVGRFEVIEGLEGIAEPALLRTLALHSTHPISVAIASALSDPPAVCESLREVAGEGMEAIYEGRLYRLGSATFTGQIDTATLTTVFFTCDGELLGQIRLGDRLRAGFAEMVASLALPTELISGDGAGPTEQAAVEAGVTRWFARCSPMEKRARVQELRYGGEAVAMVGDGINDAPALTAAQLGISLESASDMSVAVSDLIVEDLSALPRLRAIGIRGRKIASQNLFWAFFYNTLGIGVAALGYLSPLFAASAMVVSGLAVLINSRRV
jgi:P-type Cu2+ transporter